MSENRNPQLEELCPEQPQELSREAAAAVMGGSDLGLQSLMDQEQKYMQTASSIMKKTSDTNSSIVQNIK